MSQKKIRTEIEQLNQETSVERLVEGRGVQLEDLGADLVGLCPFHSGDEPTLSVNRKTNEWRCSECDAGGTAIDWVMKCEGVTQKHAVEILKDGSFFMSTASPKRIAKRSTVMKLGAVVESDVPTQEQLLQIVEFYHATLKQSPEALGYLEQRGLRSEEMLDQFKLGYSNRTLGLRLPQKNRQAGAEIRGHLTEIGILRKSGHEHFAGSIVVPMFDEQGAVVQIYGRKITAKLRKGTPLHLWLPGKRRGFWNWQSLKASKEVILAKSIIDALSFWCAGFRNVVATAGEDRFNDDYLDAFAQFGTERVLLACRRDGDGERRATIVTEKLVSAGIECFQISFPNNMDANDHYLSAGAQGLEQTIRKASWVGGKPSNRFADIQSAPESPLISDEGVGEGTEERPSESVLDISESISHETPETEPVASPLPAPSRNDLDVEVRALKPTQSNSPAELRNDEVVIRFGDRRWRVRGLEKNLSFNSLKVNLLVSVGEDEEIEAFHIDTFDLYSARHRNAFTKQAAEELRLKESAIRRDLGKVLLTLEELQERQIRSVLEPEEKKVALTDEDRAAALELLEAPDLLDRILNDFNRCGVVGEESNKLVGFIAAVSRKLETPLAVVIQSSSAAGKSSLLESILAFLPSEERIQFSAITGQSLFYMSADSLKHKVLAIAEEEGAERASYALKLLQSEGELTIASTGKESNTGRLVTETYRVEGPAAIFLTTTAIEIDEELLNRCIVLSVDEDREQTRAIHRLQRESQTLEGLLAGKDKEALLTLHRNAQRLLRPLLVANPFAEKLTFLDDRTRTRRDHMKYLTMIRSIALLHQYQRPVKHIEHQGGTVPYIEVAPEDIAVANRLAHQILGRSLDELAPQTRRLLMLIDGMVTEACEKLEIDRSDYRFTRRQIREHIGWSYKQVRVHLARLVEMEYVLTHRGGRGHQFIYELIYSGEGQDGRPFVMGLIDVESLKSNATTTALTGTEIGFDHELTTLCPPIAHGVPTGEKGSNPNDDNPLSRSLPDHPKHTSRDLKKSPPIRRSHSGAEETG